MPVPVGSGGGVVTACSECQGPLDDLASLHRPGVYCPTCNVVFDAQLAGSAPRPDVGHESRAVVVGVTNRVTVNADATIAA